MCGRVIQSSAPFRLAIVEGLDVRDSRVHNYPPRWNGAPSQELLVIRRNHYTGELSLDPDDAWRYSPQCAGLRRWSAGLPLCVGPANPQPFEMALTL